MALYTPFEATDFEQVATAFGLGRVREAIGVPEGSINTNYRLVTDRGTLFMRHTHVRSPADLQFEAALLAHLAEARFPSPVLVPTVGGAPFFEHKGGRVSLFHLITGEEKTRANFKERAAERIGAELGKMHRLCQSFDARRDNPYGPEVVRGWLIGLRDCPQDPAVPPLAERLHRALDRALAAERPLLPRGAIHADLFMDNVKWVGDRISAFFDFEMACHDAFVLDLAITLNAWCFEGGYRPSLCQALLGGYQSERRLSETEREGLYAKAVFGAVRYTASRIRDFHLSPLPPERLARKSYRTYLARVESLEALGAEGFGEMVLKT